MKRIRLILLALLLVSPLALGGKDGNELLEMCKALIDETDVVKGQTCGGYLQGIVEAHEALRGHGLCYRQDHFCLSEEVSSQQLARLAVKYLEANPEKLNIPVADEVINAFMEAFPCK